MPINNTESESAYPVRSRWDGGMESMDLVESGLTKREYFAAMALQGFCANSYAEFDQLARMAVRTADALIVELNKTEDTNAN